MIGVFAAIGSLGSAAGPWLMGSIFDATGAYHQAFVLFTVLPVIGAILAWNTRPLHWVGLRSAA